MSGVGKKSRNALRKIAMHSAATEKRSYQSKINSFELSQLHHLDWLIMKITHHLHKPLLLRKEYLYPRCSKGLVLKFVLSITIETPFMIRVCKQSIWFVIQLKALVKSNLNVIFTFVFLKINYKTIFSLLKTNYCITRTKSELLLLFQRVFILLNWLAKISYFIILPVTIGLIVRVWLKTFGLAVYSSWSLFPQTQTIE